MRSFVVWYMRENVVRSHFAARGEDLVYLVSLVCLVCLVRRTREIRQTHAPNRPPLKRPPLPSISYDAIPHYKYFHFRHNRVDFP